MSRDRGWDRDRNRDRDRDHTDDVDDLPELLDDLRATLDELDRSLGRDDPRRDRLRPRAESPARPRGRDVVRFTEEYTIPTVISVLETTVQSLELLQGVLRLADPEGRTRRPERRESRIERRLSTSAERALDDLREVVTGTEPPSDPLARDVYEEARRLTTDIEAILADARADADGRTGDRRDAGDTPKQNRGVVIPVDDGEDGSEADTTAAEDDEPRVDIDAELESIRDEVEAADSAGENEREEEETTERGQDDETAP